MLLQCFNKGMNNMGKPPYMEQFMSVMTLPIVCEISSSPTWALSGGGNANEFLQEISYCIRGSAVFQ